MSEIDDIFASKKKRPKQRRKSSSLPQPTSECVIEESSSKKRPFPETVVDLSVDLAGPSKRRKKHTISDKNSKPKKSKKSQGKVTEFEDSRGSGDRRKTEEGWSVYKEHELGLDSEGGDTPLCPFDCNCCF